MGQLPLCLSCSLAGADTSPECCLQLGQAEHQAQAFILRHASVLQVPIFPPLQTQEDMTEAVCIRLLRAALGAAAAHVCLDIRTVRTWTMNALVAERFQARLPAAAIAPAPWSVFRHGGTRLQQVV